MPKNRRPTTATPARQSAAQPPRPETSDDELTTIFADVASALQECGHEANQLLHHWLQLKKQTMSCDTASSPAWLRRVQVRLRDFGTETLEEVEADRVAREQSEQKDDRIRDLELEVARLSDAAMAAEGRASADRAAKLEAKRKTCEKISKLQKSNAQLQETNAQLRESNAELWKSLGAPQTMIAQALQAKDAKIAELTKHNAALKTRNDDLLRVNKYTPERYLYGVLRAAQKAPEFWGGTDEMATQAEHLLNKTVVDWYPWLRSLPELEDIKCRFNTAIEEICDKSEVVDRSKWSSKNFEDFKHYATIEAVIERCANSLRPLVKANNVAQKGRMELETKIKTSLKEELGRAREIETLLNEYRNALQQSEESHTADAQSL